MLDWIVLFVFLLAGYHATLHILRRSRPLEPANAPLSREEGLPEDPNQDAACRLLLGFAGGGEAAFLRDRRAADPAFAHDVDERRAQLIHAYADGSLPTELRDAFRASMLQTPGVAPEVEVERALNAVAEPEFDSLRTKLTYKPRRIDALWRKLTLPRSVAGLQSAEGPCLMVRPEASQTEGAELEGKVVAVSEGLFDVNLGLAHGLGPGDFVQIERAEGEWIGTGVITAADSNTSRAFLMGETQPRVGDRATTVLDGDFV